MVVCSDSQQAVAQISSAFAGLLSDLSFSCVISNPREPDNPIVFASPDFYRLTGYTPAEVLGRNCRFLQGPETSHQSVTEIRDAIREDRSCSVCLVNYKKNGSKFWNAFHLEPIRCLESGCVLYYVGMQADVSELVARGGAACVAAVEHEEEARAAQVVRQLSAHRAEWQQPADVSQVEGRCAADASVPSSMLCALTKIQDCFVLSDPNLPDMPIVYASPAFLKMTGYSCTEVLGRNCRFLQGPGTDPEQLRVLRSALSVPKPVTVTLLNYTKAGAPFWNCLHVAPVRDADGRVQFFAGVQLDVTAHGDQVSAEAAADGAEQAADGPLAAAAAAEQQGGAAGEVLGRVDPSPWMLLQQKGIVGAVRVATRALATHGLRRAVPDQHPPTASDHS